ncbi:MAG: DUF2341 domain-containing protein [Candidatus Aenigmatarchaeota archaeon]
MVKRNHSNNSWLKYFFLYFLVFSFGLIYFLGNKFILIFLAVSGIFFFNWKRREIIIYYLFISFIVIYRLILGNFPAILASTPSPSPPTVVDNPDPQQGGGTITFSCSPNACQPGAPGELIKLLICKNNSASCVLGSQWSYRRPITISNTQNSNTLTDYQVLVTNPIYNETGLIGSWHFNEGSGTIAFDSSGKNNHGTLRSDVSWSTDAKFGKAVNVSGSTVSNANEGVTLPSSAWSTINNMPSGTVALWVKILADATTDNHATDSNIFLVKQSNYENTYLLLGTTTTSRTLFWHPSNQAGNFISDDNLALNTWYHVAVTWNGSHIIFYVNGAQVHSFASTAGIPDDTTITCLSIAGGCGDSYSNGRKLIDEVRIYNRALSASEIQALYQAKARLDYGDIRFTDSDGTQLNYWQEADGKFWVKVPSIPASSTKTIYVYYGNPNATSASSFGNTFGFSYPKFVQLGPYGNSYNRNFTIIKKWGDALNLARVDIWCSNTGGARTERIYEDGVLIATNSSVICPTGAPGSWSNGVFRNVNLQGKETIFNDGTAANDYRGIRFNSTSSGSVLLNFTHFIAGNAAPPLTVYQVEFAAPVVLNVSKVDVLAAGTGSSTFSLKNETSTIATASPSLSNNVWSTVFTNQRFRGKILTISFDSGTGQIQAANITLNRLVASPEPTTSIGNEETNIASNYLWNQSSAVASNPTATYTCPSCTSATNTYYGVTYSVDEAVWTAFTQALSFTCKKENLCSCSAGECFNECKNDPDGSGAWCCNSNQCSHDGSCYTLVELSPTGSSSACILGENIAHNTQGSINYRYATYDGQLYYCGTSNADKDAYAETTDLIPGDKIGLCQCRYDGTWNCGGVVKIRGGRIRII